MNYVRRVGLVLLAAVASSCGGGDGITVTSHVASVSVAPSSSNIAPGGTVQLTATPKDASGNTLTGLTATWTSSNNAAATVVGGLVTGVATGFASITATIGGVSGTASVNVAPADPCAPVAMNFPGTATGSVSPSGCVSIGFPAAIYRFTATGSGGTTFSVTSSIATTMDVMSDPPGNDVALNTAAAPASVTGEWLLPPGSFLFRVRAQSATGSGTFTITGASSNGATNNGSGCTAGVPLRLFVVGGTYSGQSLNTGDCRETDQSFTDYYFIRSLKPCKITFTPTGFDAYLAINDFIGGTNLFIKNDGLVGVAEQITLPTCSTASGNPIQIEANTFAAGETGTYTLTIEITGGGSIVSGDQPANDGAILGSAIDVRRLLDQLRRPLIKPPR